MLPPSHLTHALRSALVCATFVAALLCAPLTALATPISGTTCDPTPSGDNADSIFPGAAFTCESESFTYTDTLFGDSHEFFFAGFEILNDLSFEDVLQDFVVTMTAFFVHPGNSVFLDRIPNPFFPVTMDTFAYGDVWTYFRVETPTPVPGVDFTPPWTQVIAYFESNATPAGPHQMLRDNVPQDTFAEVITVPGSFCEVCGPPSDPTIAGKANDFSDTTVVVPEPASMLLMVGGLAAVLYRRRRGSR